MSTAYLFYVYPNSYRRFRAALTVPPTEIEKSVSNDEDTGGRQKHHRRLASGETSVPRSIRVELPASIDKRLLVRRAHQPLLNGNTSVMMFTLFSTRSHGVSCVALEIPWFPNKALYFRHGKFYEFCECSLV